MPFEKIYSVNFSGRNLAPDFNPLNWPAMQLSDDASAVADTDGIILTINRHYLADDEVRNSVFLLPPDGMPLDTRLMLRVQFDKPNAFSEPIPVKLEPVYPEPWAVGLRVSPYTVLGTSKSAVQVTTQFVAEGVRLNTPFSLQGDRAALLIQPLDYERFATHTVSERHPHRPIRPMMVENRAPDCWIGWSDLSHPHSSHISGRCRSRWERKAIFIPSSEKLG